jgi:3-oxoacyl-[acyl-carrier protein] reductase
MLCVTADQRADFDGRVALVTGGGRGIGRALAIGLAAGGATVAVVARTREQIDSVAAEIRDAGGTAVAFSADLTDLTGLAALVADVESTLGPVDILINNAAAIAPIGPTAGIPTTAWSDALTLNVISPVTLTSAVLPGMISRGWGRVVNISSGVVGRPHTIVGGNVYVAGKAALEAHTVNLAAELADTGVTVNAYRPGRIDTEMQTYVREQDAAVVGGGLVERFRASKADGELLTPEETAQVLLRRLAGEPDSGAIWAVADR